MNNDDNFIREFERHQAIRSQHLRLNAEQHVPVRRVPPPQQQQMSTPFRMEHFFVRQLLGEDVETGGNIQLHQDWIEPVLKHNPDGKPIMFRVDNNQKNIFCGVNSWHTFRDPDCDNRVAYLPKWMMVHLGLKSNDIIRLVPMQIPSGKYVKLRSFTELVTMDFQKEYLESQLKQFTCLTKGQELMFGDHPVFVVEVGIDKSTKSIYDTICIINTDLEVDFDEPIDYTPPPPPPPPLPVMVPVQEPISFTGKGLVLGSSTTSNIQEPELKPEPEQPKGFKAFSGQGHRLK